MTKKELINTLEDFLKGEEVAIPTYLTYLKNTFFLSFFSKAEQEEIRHVLDTLKEDTVKHLIIYENLIRRIKESDQDVY
ncbi:MAG: hypothetical protein ACD_79C01130G0005 [uncultured bacterium]|nr:MAG: hypothetical protein ACD_79C01130G0005 [uncultured bacterium]